MLTSIAMGVLWRQCMEFQSAGRLDGIVYFHGSVAVHGSLRSPHRIWKVIPAPAHGPRIAWLDSRPATEASCLLQTARHATSKKSDDIKNVLYTLGPQLPRICCSVLYNTTNHNRGP